MFDSQQSHRKRQSIAAQVAAAVLSDRYISDRFLPDKAIDLMDEASAKAGVASCELHCIAVPCCSMLFHAVPALLQLMLDRMDSINEELDRLRAQQSEQEEKWQKEREALNSLQDLRQKIEDLERELAEAERSFNLERAGQIK
eukprot:Skav222372  [mRNA]  locus=scaffold2692:200615:201643:+ [translate_table: standard]